jgi:hypothetical protein
LVLQQVVVLLGWRAVAQSALLFRVGAARERLQMAPPLKRLTETR